MNKDFNVLWCPCICMYVHRYIYIHTSSVIFIGIYMYMYILTLFWTICIIHWDIYYLDNMDNKVKAPKVNINHLFVIHARLPTGKNYKRPTRWLTSNLRCLISSRHNAWKKLSAVSGYLTEAAIKIYGILFLSW